MSKKWEKSVCVRREYDWALRIAHTKRYSSFCSISVSQILQHSIPYSNPAQNRWAFYLFLSNEFLCSFQPANKPTQTQTKRIHRTATFVTHIMNIKRIDYISSHSTHSSVSYDLSFGIDWLDLIFFSLKKIEEKKTTKYSFYLQYAILWSTNIVCSALICFRHTTKRNKSIQTQDNCGLHWLFLPLNWLDFLSSFLFMSFHLSIGTIWDIEICHSQYGIMVAVCRLFRISVEPRFCAQLLGCFVPDERFHNNWWSFNAIFEAKKKSVN